MTASESRLRAALKDACEGLEEMMPYVPEYFVEKWQLDGYVTRAKAALEVPEASKRGKSNRARGHDTEVMVANYLRDQHGFPDAATTRKVLGHDGSRQPGDVTFAPGVVLSVKHVKTPAWPAWIREVKAEAMSAGPSVPETFSPRVPAVVHRRLGVRDVGEWPTAVPEAHWDDALVMDRCDQRIGDVGQLLHMFPSCPVIANRGLVVMRFRTFAEAFRLDQ